MRKNTTWYAAKTNCPIGSGFNYTVCTIITVLLVTVVFFLCTDSAYCEHDTHTFTYDFTGSTDAVDMQEFTIDNDGALYVKLLSYTPSESTTAKPTIGIFPLPDGISCPDRYYSLVQDAEVGILYGPYYMQADTYRSYFSLLIGADDYFMQIEYRRQLVPNDVEPNDTKAEAQNLGILNRYISMIFGITGHLGYLGCIHDQWDYFQFGVDESGEFLFDIQFDTPFKEKTGCIVQFHLMDNTTGTLLYYDGPQDKTALGPVYLLAAHTFTVQMYSSSGCYDTITEGGGTYVLNNKAGAYQIYLHRIPPPVVPFEITNVTVKPSVLWPGESLNGKVFIQNNESSVSDKMNLILSVYAPGSYFPPVEKEYSSFNLAAHEQRVIEFSLAKLLAPRVVSSLIEGRYDIKATAIIYGFITDGRPNSSRYMVYFKVMKGKKAIPGPVNLLLKEVKKE